MSAYKQKLTCFLTDESFPICLMYPCMTVIVVSMRQYIFYSYFHLYDMSTESLCSHE